MSLEYAEQRRPDAIYILSAKHGLVELDALLDPYNLTLNELPDREIKRWAGQVISSLSAKHDLHNDHFVILAGQKYRKHLVSSITSYEIPLDGLTIGRQLQWLHQRI